MKARGVTLLEVLVVIGIASVIAGITYPIMVSAKHAAYERRSVADMKQIAIAALIYREDWKQTEFGTMEEMGLPESYKTLFSSSKLYYGPFIPTPPIYPSTYPLYYWMPLPAFVSGIQSPWAAAALKYSDHTLLVCDPWIEGFVNGHSRAMHFDEPNRIYGVDLSGQLMRKKAYGLFFEYDRWEPNK